jgi:hypothetical protein
MRLTLASAGLAFAIAGAASAQPTLTSSAGAEQASLTSLLQQAADYTRHYEKRFAVIIGDEQYEQRAGSGPYRGPRGLRTRKMASEMMFLWLAHEQSWLSVRNVVSVDGDPIKDSQKRLDRLLSADAPIGVAHLRQLRNEGARYNIGTIRRNFNDPMFPLQFLESEAQHRFAFTLTGQETVDGIVTSKVTFDEQVTPTFVQDGKRDLSSHGIFWIAGDGRVLRTRFDVSNPVRALTATVIVDYRPDARLDMLVPVTMHEFYVASGMAPEQIECTAHYSNFRQFETGGRLITDR